MQSVDLAYQLDPTSHTFIYKKKPEPILPKINLLLKDVVLTQGDIWHPELHIAQLTKDNEMYKFVDAIQSGILSYTPQQLDTSKPGIYPVVYTYAGISSSAKVIVKEKNEATAVPQTSAEVSHIGVSNQTNTKEKQQLKLLPKTGEKKNYLAVILGLLLVMVSLYYINHKHKPSN